MKKSIKKIEFKPRHFSQLQFIALGFIIMIFTGAILLNLPYASKDSNSIGFIDALFTSTSASCVTGLVPADTASHWTFFGHLVIITLIQIGGLGFISIGVFFAVVLRQKIGLRARGLLKESINSLEIGGVVKLTKRILYGTALIELIGAVFLSFRFIPEFGLINGIWYSLFHSISAFCNAGFDLMGDKYGEYCSLTPYCSDILVNLVIMFLIIIGGIGFVVWDDVLKHRFRFSKYRLHSKISIVMTIILIIGAGILFLITEKYTVLAGMDIKTRLLAAAFSSVTPRTAGFNSVDTASLSNSGKLITMVLMFIGGSPGSTAGGIKTTTLFVLGAYVCAYIRQTHGVDVFKRRLAEDSIKKAATILSINLFLVLTAAVIISTIEKLDITDIMFEICSAMGTSGMSTGITRQIGSVSKIVLIVLMYLGRVGSLSFALAFTRNEKMPNIMQPKEDINIG